VEGEVTSVSVSVSAGVPFSQIATGVPYSESHRKKVGSGPILIKLRRNLTCFRPVVKHRQKQRSHANPHIRFIYHRVPLIPFEHLSFLIRGMSILGILPLFDVG
jgi:hypothetical protein